MKRAYARSQYAKPCEQYCREAYPSEAESIFRTAEDYYRGFMKDMPDLGENMMAKNMLDWFTILAFYEASGHRMDGETLLTIKRRDVDRMKFLGKLVDGNKHQWPYKLFERMYRNFIRMQEEHQAKGEWLDSWKIELNPDHRTEGFCFHLVGCPIARHAKEHGYTGNCCRISAKPTTSLLRSCTQGLSAQRPKRWAATAATIGMWATKARRLRRIRIWSRYDPRLCGRISHRQNDPI